VTGMLAPVRHQRRAVPQGASQPFSLVDELSCYFDSAAEPNNVHIEILLPGHLDVARLRAAVTAALDGRPRARARRAAGGPWRRGYAWEFPASADADPVQVAGWRTESELAQARERFLAAAPSLDQSPPFRLLLAIAPDQDTLILNAHHAAFDGQSCLRLLQSVAAHYSAPGGSRPASAGSGPGPTPPEQHGRPPEGLRAARTPLPRPAARIAARRLNGGRPRRRAPGYGFVLLSCQGVPVAPQPAAGPRVTVNDLLVAALIATIATWNQACRDRRRGRGRLRPIRISVPADARAPGHHEDLGNLSRLCTVTADPHLADPARSADLLANIATQTSIAKQRPGPQVNPALAAVAKLPVPAGARRRVLRLAIRCLGGLASDTSLLSNLGNVKDPPAFAGLVPDRMWFSTPAHMPRGLAVGAITINGDLQLCFRYRRALFDDAAARDFVARYRTVLGTLAAAHRQGDGHDA
jgi:NRPS condensation-like uncharacterized protein